MIAGLWLRLRPRTAAASRSTALTALVRFVIIVTVVGVVVPVVRAVGSLVSVMVTVAAAVGCGFTRDLGPIAIGGFRMVAGLGRAGKGGQGEQQTGNDGLVHGLLLLASSPRDAGWLEIAASSLTAAC